MPEVHPFPQIFMQTNNADPTGALKERNCTKNFLHDSELGGIGINCRVLISGT